MAYPHDAFPFPMEHQPQANMYFHHPVQYHTFPQQPQSHQDVMFQQHLYPDYVDLLPLGMMPEDFDDSAEASTRPRLTKEQVEVLETQFQAHPKPNSMVKKQLAMQTKLTLPRVANWFQNRRAKAKQQRKQEEFENAQNMGTASGGKDDSIQGTVESSSKTSSPARQQSVSDDRSESTGSKSPTKSSESSNDASWASLQRALSAAESARQLQRAQEQAQATLAMPPPDLPHYNNPSKKSYQTSQRAQTLSLSPSSDWSKNQSLNGLASPSPVLMPATMQDLGFDFGFDQDSSTPSQSNAVEDSPDSGPQQYLVSPEEWTSFPQQSSTHQNDFATLNRTSPLPLPQYPDSRRGSGSDELTANLGTFALAGTPPVDAMSSHSMASSMRSTDGEIDIASRRKRPRPAALTSASLRSRSYGQLTSTSPAFRPGPPSGNVLRHVKSTGHSLNSHYAGIRKASLPQKSPLNIANFNETESFKRLMAQQAAAVASSKTPLTTPLRPDMNTASFLQELATSMGMVEETPGSMVLPSEAMAQFQQLSSPPHTPFQNDYMMHAATMSMPPPSGRPQYASFAECTPPYSAGPLTNSTCWSDAPLHSPDVTGFPSNHFLGSIAFTQQQDPSVQQWVLPSEHAVDSGLHHLGIPDEDKKTEFFITKFPGQKEEYASVAQHVVPTKPKNYVFANTAPSDYNG